MKWLARLGVALLALAVLAIAAAFFLSRTEWAESKLEQRLGEALGREVELEGLSLLPRWPPTAHAERLRISNPEWAKSANLIDAKDVRATFDASALLSGRVRLTGMAAAQADAGLERDGERATWKLGKDGGEAQRFALERASVEEGHVFYAEHDRDTVLDLQVQGSVGTEDASLDLHASGRFRGQGLTSQASLDGKLSFGAQGIGPVNAEVALSGKVEGLPEYELRGDVRSEGNAWHLTGLEARVGELPFSGEIHYTPQEQPVVSAQVQSHGAQASFHGSAGISGPMEGQVSLSGKSLATLQPLVNAELPATAPYSLKAQLRQEGDAWHLTGLEGQVGDSQLAGEAHYTPGAQPIATAELHSKTLRLGDLGLEERFKGKQMEALHDVSAQLSLDSAQQSLGIDAQAHVNGAQASFDGSVALGGKGIGPVSGQLSLSGESLAKLQGLVNAKLPDTAPYSVQGRLRQEGDAWHLTGIDARVGDSWLSGEAHYTPAAQPIATAKLQSKTLDLSDLGLEERLGGKHVGTLHDVNARVSLNTAEHSLAVDAHAQVSGTQASFDGRIGFGGEGVGPVSGEVAIAGKSLANLQGLVNAALPATPPYKLQGQIRKEANAWHLTGLGATVGKSHLSGEVHYREGKRPFVSADLHSKRLDVGDLGLGGRKAKRGKDVIPEIRFDAKAWDALDARVELTAERLAGTPAGALRNVKVQISLERGLLQVDPLAFGLGNGRVEAELVLNSREKPLFGSLDARVRGVDPGTLVEALRVGGTSLGNVHGRVALAGQGSSLRQLLGSSDGDVVLMMNKGDISGLLVELLGLDLAEALLLLGTRKKETVTLRCAVADFNVRRGVARTDAFIVDTSDTRVGVQGSIDLSKETIDLTVRPQPKDPSLGAARTPIDVAGTLRDPQIAPRAGPLAARGGAAALLGIINPLLAVLPFVEPGAGDDVHCKELLAAARMEAEAASAGR